MAKIKRILLTAVLLTALVLVSGTAAAVSDIEIDQDYIDDYIENGTTEGVFSDLSRNYVLIEDIEIKNETWNSIGNESKPFTGTFDGQGHSIIFTGSEGTTTFKNFDGKNDEIGYGFFGIVGKKSGTDEIEIKNVNVVLNSNLTNFDGSKFYDIFGSLVGYVNVSSSDYFSMENCSLSSNDEFEIKGSSYVGGLAGYIENGEFTSCSVSGDDISVTAISWNAGGLIGEIINGEFNSCFVSGNGVSVTAKDYAGGLAGRIENGEFNSCFVSSDDISVTSGNGRAGGLVGLIALDGKIENCYSTADVKGHHDVGGLVGSSWNSGAEILSSYFAGTVSLSDDGANEKIGGIVGSYNTGEPIVTDCVYLDTAGGELDLNEFGTAVSDEYMKKIATYKVGGSVINDWDISDKPDPDAVWFIYEDETYPQLSSSVIFISNLEELKKVGTNEFDSEKGYWYTLDANYVLINDIEIDCGTWEPIGGLFDPFTGTFDGSTYDIEFTSETTFSSSTESHLGLFGSAGGDITNVSLIVSKDLTFDGDVFGVLAGFVYGNVSDCSVSGDAKISGGLAGGGLIGSLGGSVSNCSASGSISVISDEEIAGGLIGEIGRIDERKGTVTSSHVSGGTISVSAPQKSGGFVGSLHNGTIENCSVSGDISIKASGNNSGGFAGYARLGKIANSSVIGDTLIVDANWFSGGFIGYAYPDDAATEESEENLEIVDCYSSGKLSVIANTNYAGGFIGGFTNFIYNEFSAFVNISNCSVKDVESIDITAENTGAGGFSGLIGNNGGTLENCSVLSDGLFTVTSKASSGGLVGHINPTTYDSAILNGSVSGRTNSIFISSQHYSGGLVGYFDEGEIKNSFVDGTIYVEAEGANGRAGGLVGAFDGLIKDCYSTAQVEAQNHSGGLVGRSAYDTTEIKSSYFAGTVSLIESEVDNPNIGGILGSYYTEPIVSDCVYLDTVGEGFTNENGTAVSSEDMKKLATYKAKTGVVENDWDISDQIDDDTVWFIVENQIYPIFSKDYIPPVSDKSSSGSGTGQAIVVNSTAEIPNLTDDTIRNPSEIPDVQSPNANSDSGDAGGYGNEESGTDWTLYIIIGVGLIVVIGGVAYFLNKRK
ncbi:hypothetical protein MmiAt1_09730 [Methanimicrococcus sp. At1]|uniref:GLUG domain-containing protein n=1 Tax=Methanimicrococcus hacksteinii TaxID=3028293 RepID=A0ABU3VPS4_9EURY|nr:GLUG motif-containing protein [Methanimicrococcus sp. At1]MDV0445396.1 hypothetical protein [Methanimicrococcus sp. At1]